MLFPKRFFGLIAVLALATGAFAQVIRPADLQRAETMRSGQRHIRGGQSLEAADSGATQLPQAVGAKLLVWSDKKFYLPGEEIKIRALGFASDANQLQISVTEIYSDTNGKQLFSDVYACECGESNNGYAPSLSNFNWITLVSKRVAGNRNGRYDFYISANRLPGYGAPGVPYQQTHLVVFATTNNVQENSPLRIDSVQQYGSAGPILILVGSFPKGVPLFYFVGAIPWDGAYSPTPSAISTDGQTLVLPGISGYQMEGRVVLMMPDGTFSTTSPQTFVPLPAVLTSQPLG
jgi:hypothetical protein